MTSEHNEQNDFKEISWDILRSKKWECKYKSEISLQLSWLYPPECK